MCSVFCVSPYRNVIKRKYMYNLKISGRGGVHGQTVCIPLFLQKNSTVLTYSSVPTVRTFFFILQIYISEVDHFGLYG